MSPEEFSYKLENFAVLGMKSLEPNSKERKILEKKKIRSKLVSTLGKYSNIYSINSRRSY